MIKQSLLDMPISFVNRYITALTLKDYCKDSTHIHVTYRNVCLVLILMINISQKLKNKTLIYNLTACTQLKENKEVYLLKFT